MLIWDRRIHVLLGDFRIQNDLRGKYRLNKGVKSSVKKCDLNCLPEPAVQTTASEVGKTSRGRREGG